MKASARLTEVSSPVPCALGVPSVVGGEEGTFPNLSVLFVSARLRARLKTAPQTGGGLRVERRGTQPAEP